ncbi:MAG: glycosyltransferase family 2 protein [Bacteroidota bacterium]|nr:glycosyltransferase family 2 protein [Bacteroidota bacterium]
MKVSGFSFIRNAITFDYPIVEAITSILPLCDEFIVAVGNSEDDTRELISSINSQKIRILDTTWDERMRKGGRVLAAETDKAFSGISRDSDWAFYIQGDEVLHEKYHAAVQEAMLKWKDQPEVEGLLFNYLHFYGSYDFVGDSRRWYRKEIRIVRNDPSIHSYRDAQGFRKNNSHLRVKPVDATMYHYGWVKPPEHQQAKQKSFQKLWHDDDWIEKNLPRDDVFDYSRIDSLRKFEDTHPSVMKKRIRNRNWEFSFDPTQKNLGIRKKILHVIEEKTGWRIGEYKNYRII